MRETLKGYGKYFLGMCILIYLCLSIILKDNSFLDNFDLAVTISMLLAAIYSKWLWKYNPLENNPKIYGEYKMTFISTYDNSKRIMHVIIKQDLFSNRIYMTTKESKSESISSSIITKKDSCELIYTYQNIPIAVERNHSEIHFGTCRLSIIDNKIISGEYYTDRKTIGIIKNVKRLK